MARTRSRGDQYYEQQVQVSDRFSDLSDDILHHILSFLNDTTSAVQTSVLSHRWRYLWKDVPALHLRAVSFHTGKRFETFVSNLLSLRSRRATLHSVSFDYWSWFPEEHGDHEVFDMVMRYAASLGRRDHHHGGGGGLLRVLSISNFWRRELHRMATSVARHHQHESLETLKLAKCNRLTEVAISFGTMLTTLELRGCSLDFHDDDDDPFASLPRLKCLKILDCHLVTPAGGFKVSGLQLLTLEVGNYVTIRELLAPRLESFTYSCLLGSLVRLHSSSLTDLPSLVHASVRIVHRSTFGEKQAGTYGKKHAHAVTRLLRGLRNAKSLDLCFEDDGAHILDYCFEDDEDDTTTWRPRYHSTLIETIKPKIEKGVAKFTRLKTLRIRYLPD